MPLNLCVSCMMTPALVVAVVCCLVAAALVSRASRPWSALEPADLHACVISVPNTRSRTPLQRRFAGQQPFVFVDGVDGSKLPPHPTLSPGQLGCAQSHMRLWRMLAGSPTPVLIFEDDAALHPEWRARVKAVLASLDSAVDIVFLGSCQELSGGRCYAAGLRRSVLPRCTHGYMLTPRGLQKLAAWAEVAGLQVPIDEHLASLVRYGYLRSLTADPPLVTIDDQEGSLITAMGRW